MQTDANVTLWMIILRKGVSVIFLEIGIAPNNHFVFLFKFMQNYQQPPQADWSRIMLTKLAQFVQFLRTSKDIGMLFRFFRFWDTSVAFSFEFNFSFDFGFDFDLDDSNSPWTFFWDPR